ncbi:hypothetical protein BSL78_18865 [Apostichopus japonicus]|uniref:Uncharacterized protein n=1 Tax=Stichopus japonicus TaxID=307972 RepID=A0A2G8K8H9_STIJA|nr:hypothetical protein BSL78_18865 [Apostichopus japonicus]
MLLPILLLLTMGAVDRTSAHLCIISPVQRGSINIQQAGDSSCFRHQSPCGGQPAEDPKVSLIGGKTTFIKFQQNFNHYEVGYPGYMDIALSTSPDATTFSTLVVIGDRYEHAQWNQQNYTIPVVIPNIKCSHCVLRMRYVSNKPGEEIFYQCSDVTILKQNMPTLTTSDLSDQLNFPTGLERLNKFLVRSNRDSNSVRDSTQLYGFSWDILQTSGSDLISVDTNTGEITKKSYEPFYFNMGIGVMYGTPSPMAQSYKFLMDQIACHSRKIPYIFLLEHRNGNITATPNKILWIDLEAKVIAGEYEIKQPISGHFIALSPYQQSNFLSLVLEEDTEKKGSYNLTFSTLDYMGNYQKELTVTIGSQFINYLWATPDLTKQLYYVVMGDENSARDLKASILTYNITKKALVTSMPLDVSNYTISSVQVYEKTGKLLAVSPGLFGQEMPAWSLVEVDPTTGNISFVMDIAPQVFSLSTMEELSSTWTKRMALFITCFELQAIPLTS